MPEDLATDTPDGSPRLRARDLLAVSLVFLACALIASYPLVWHLSTKIVGSLHDPLQHLWIMRWYRTCLLEGRSPVICPELQYPTGAPLGLFSPLHLQSMLFIPLSLATGNDVLSFNLVWLAAMTTTGLGTFVLTFQAVRNRPCAAFAGMLAMYSTPMLLHGRAHLELITLGGFPLFLAAWMRFVDRPSRRAMIAAAGLFVIVALSAAYYVVFATIPAAMYVLWRASGEGRGAVLWIATRIRPLAGFAMISLPLLVLTFWNHIWAHAHGYASERSLAEFDAYNAPPWTFVTPTVMHRLGAFLPADVYAAAGLKQTMGERASYLGVVTAGLVFLAAWRRERFARRGFLWLALGSFVVLAWGSSIKAGSWEIGLPSGWLRRHAPLFPMLRVPARFNLFVGVVAAVIAAAGLKGLLARLSRNSLRVVVYLGLVAAAMADLLLFPFPVETVPPIPPGYREILARDPSAAFVEVPQYPSTGSPLYSAAGFWQSIHRGRTNAGYSGNGNTPMDALVTYNSPFFVVRFEDPAFLADPGWTSIDIVGGADFLDYAWLYLQQNGYRYIVVHRWEGYADGYPRKLDRLAALLEPARTYEDAQMTIYDRDRLPKPDGPAILTAEGWRVAVQGRSIRAVGKTSKLAVFSPDASRPVTIALNASAFRSPKTARLVSEGRELARWTIVPDREFRTYRTPPIFLPEGISSLSLECDAEETPKKHYEYAQETDSRPYSLRVAGLTISSETDRPEPPTRQVAAQPRPHVSR